MKRFIIGLLFVVSSLGYAEEFQLGQMVKANLEHWQLEFCNTNKLQITGIITQDEMWYELSPVYCFIEGKFQRVELLATKADITEFSFNE